MGRRPCLFKKSAALSVSGEVQKTDQCVATICANEFVGLGSNWSAATDHGEKEAYIDIADTGTSSHFFKKISVFAKGGG